MQRLFLPTLTSLFTVIGLVAGIWSLSAFGYELISDRLAITDGYNGGPVVFSLYYAVFCGLAVMLFHPSLSKWARGAAPPEDRLAPVFMALLCALFAFAVLPFLPEARIPTEDRVDPIVVARSWYFLPKSVEVAFQQILITALVVVLAVRGLRTWQIAVLTALLFGGFHLTLALSGANPFYVLRYTIAATLFGAIAPYQMLRMRNGFVYSYALHWGWYALDTTIWRLVFPAT